MKIDWTDREQVRAYNRKKSRERRAANPEASREAVRNYAASRKHDPSWARMRRSHQIKTLYGLTLDQAEEYMIAQWGMCAICKTKIVFQHKDRRHKACIDHDHITGKFRGLLCSPCNIALGCFRENPDTLRNAANYLERKGSTQ